MSSFQLSNKFTQKKPDALKQPHLLQNHNNNPLKESLQRASSYSTRKQRSFESQETAQSMILNNNRVPQSPQQPSTNISTVGYKRAKVESFYNSKNVINKQPEKNSYLNQFEDYSPQNYNKHQAIYNQGSLDTRHNPSESNAVTINSKDHDQMISTSPGKIKYSTPRTAIEASYQRFQSGIQKPTLSGANNNTSIKRRIRIKGQSNTLELDFQSLIGSQILKDLETEFNQKALDNNAQWHSQLKNQKNSTQKALISSMDKHPLEHEQFEKLNQLRKSYDTNNRRFKSSYDWEGSQISTNKKSKREESLFQFQSELYQGYSDTSKKLFQEKDEKTKALDKEFKSKFVNLKETIMRELDLNSKLFEVRNNQDTFKEISQKQVQSMIEGTDIIIHEQFKDLLDFDVTKIKDNEDFVEQILLLTKNFRFLVRVLKNITSNLEPDLQFTILKSFSKFWKCVSLSFEYAIQNQQSSLVKLEQRFEKTYDQKFKDFIQKYEDTKNELDARNQAFKKMKKDLESTIEKYGNDKRELTDILLDRENQIKMITDPRHVRDLKDMLKELDQSVEVIDQEKQIQYDQMSKLIEMMSKDLKDFKVKDDKGNRVKQLFNRIKSKIKNEVQEELNHNLKVGNTVVVHEKRHQTQPLSNVDALVEVQNVDEEFQSPQQENQVALNRKILAENDRLSYGNSTYNLDQIKQLLLKILNSDEDFIFYEFNNQKEALLRKEKLIQQITLQIKQIHGLDKNDPQFKEISLKIDLLYEELNQINNGMWQGWQSSNGQHCNQEVQTDISTFGEDENQLNKGFNNGSKSIKDQQNNSEQIKANNPIMSALSKLFIPLASDKLQNDQRTGKLSEGMILKMMEISMEEKVKIDMETERNSDGEHKKQQSFSGFLYDNILMQYGLKSIAVKKVLQLCSGLKKSQNNPYASILGQIIGVFTPSLQRDQINVVLKAFMFFKETQNQWTRRASYLKYNDDIISNLQNGGECGICEIQEELRLAIDKETFEKLSVQMKPEQIKKLEPSNQAQIKKFELEFSLVRIVHKVSKIGKDLKLMFDTMDSNKNGQLSKEQLLTGLRSQLGLFISDDEAIELVKYFDSNANDNINFADFSKKLNFTEIFNKINNYTITKVDFIELILKEWEHQKRKDKDRIKELFHKFDANGDGVLVLDEFETFLKSLDPNLKKKQVVTIFRKALDSNDSVDDALNDEIFAQIIIDRKIGGIGQEYFTDYLGDKYTIRENTKFPLKRTQTIK